MRRSKLDAIDKKILQNLQADGRMTNVELAKVVGISAPPCLRRVRALEEAGYIHSYHAQIDPAILGYSVTVYAMVRLESQAEKDSSKPLKNTWLSCRWCANVICWPAMSISS